MRIAILTLVLWLGLLGVPLATADPGALSVDPSSAEGAVVLAPAVADVAAQLGKPVRLDVRSLKAADGWAFLWSAMQEPDGNPVDYAGSPFAEAAANGGMSKKYVALLHRDDQGWGLVDRRVGPSDIPWAGWSAQYGAPAAIFDIPVY
ncbi:hypothetical protein [Mycobacteroides immunogenum]|uniref:Uncharacterized protein n=1 Tax=Mycobacteroides immunogenum TaxID=83262 RepID=A0A7V8LMI2_9MYCO|nr:hypothetical protein [Mycobacteroides immunogenum]AMT72703.1 hypothetical protein ABG82_23025 [Mycobacteroides immunogenum]ANO05864.1 hypothetical protein BAB75_23305 [Mycobacteroides immunogenum]KIU40982.1 hypothetical protein TL11_07755 [Mycobacteroides immunogenum]KPG06069.1 hypothetical protein AN909_19065 [Mycobacteroides immunogenum]KPG07724.1 hypothetical protein AN908_18545 [Mycobacteroides immunogenum]